MKKMTIGRGSSSRRRSEQREETHNDNELVVASRSVKMRGVSKTKVEEGDAGKTRRRIFRVWSAGVFLQDHVEIIGYSGLSYRIHIYSLKRAAVACALVDFLKRSYPVGCNTSGERLYGGERASFMYTCPLSEIK